MKQELDEKKLAKLTEMLGEVEIAEQKAREMSEFATAMAEKWQRRMAARRSATHKQGIN